MGRRGESTAKWSHSEDEGGTEVGVEVLKEAEGYGEGDFVLDVNIKTVERIVLEEFKERIVIGFKLKR